MTEADDVDATPEDLREGERLIEEQYGSIEAATEHYNELLDDSSRAATLTHEPLPGGKGKGLWGMKGVQLPAYIQHVANDLLAKGKLVKSRAISMAKGIVANWAKGHDGKGHSVSAETQAKAAAAITEWEALRVKAKATPNKDSGRTAVQYSRTYGLEDISVRTGAFEDGRTVEAYAAVFDTPTEIRDQEGEYVEELDRSIFNRAIDHARPAGNRQNWKCGVFYNHARTLFGTPSDRHSEPIGVCLDIKADPRGLLTVTRYLPGADNILDAIREGAISSYSFSGAFMRSVAVDPSTGSETPVTGPTRYRRSRGGALTKVKRMESSLREYGPTPFPAYDDALVVGMRAEQIALALTTLDPAERARLFEILGSEPGSTGDIQEFVPQDEAGTSSHDESAPGDSPSDRSEESDDEHSTRSPGRKLWDMRMSDQLAAAGIRLES